MIIHQKRQIDSEDMAVLFAAVVKFDAANDEAEDIRDVSLARSGFMRVLDRCRKAADLLAMLHVDEGDEWDGVVWLELLESFEDDSLAAQLLLIDEDELCEDDEVDDQIRAIVMDWLQENDQPSIGHEG